MDACTRRQTSNPDYPGGHAGCAPLATATLSIAPSPACRAQARRHPGSSSPAQAPASSASFMPVAAQRCMRTCRGVFSVDRAIMNTWMAASRCQSPVEGEVSGGRRQKAGGRWVGLSRALAWRAQQRGSQWGRVLGRKETDAARRNTALQQAQAQHSTAQAQHRHRHSTGTAQRTAAPTPLTRALERQHWARGLALLFHLLCYCRCWRCCRRCWRCCRRRACSRWVGRWGRQIRGLLPLHNRCLLLCCWHQRRRRRRS